MSTKPTSGRLARWSLALQEYQFTINYRAGLKNQNADCLSRRAYPDISDNGSVEDSILPNLFSIDKDSDEVHDVNEVDSLIVTFEYDCVSQFKPNEVNKVTVSHVNNTELGSETELDLFCGDEESLVKARSNCNKIGPLYKYIQSGILPKNDSDARKLVIESEQYGMQNNLLFHIYEPRTKGMPKTDKQIHQLVVPVNHRHQVLSQYHDSPTGGHQGFDRTYHSIKIKYYWPGMYKDIFQYVLTCQTCQRSKQTKPTTKATLVPMKVANVFDRWHIDILGPLTPTAQGFKYLLLVVDSFSRWIECFPMKDQEALTVAKLLYSEVFCRFGAPHTLVSDRGRNFMSKLVTALCEMFQVKRHFTSSYHPQTNSTCERLNRTLATCLR